MPEWSNPIVTHRSSISLCSESYSDNALLSLKTVTARSNVTPCCLRLLLPSAHPTQTDKQIAQPLLHHPTESKTRQVGLFKPPLLFDEARPGLWGVWRTRVIRRFAKKRNGFVGVEFSDLLTPDTLQILAGEFPSLGPSSAKRDLFRSPISQCR